MSGETIPNLNPNTERVAAENCCADQIMLSIFEYVAGDQPSSVAQRSDHDEIIRFSNALIENEFIFGSPSEEILETVNRKLSSKSAQNKLP